MKPIWAKKHIYVSDGLKKVWDRDYQNLYNMGTSQWHDLLYVPCTRLIYQIKKETI